MRPRVGHIQFINCLPLYYGLVKSHALWDVELIKGTPTELNRYLIEEKLDICPISSIEYARHWREFMMVPDIAVGSDGPVTSIFLVSKLPIHELDGKRIALTNTSATSQVLMKIILHDRYGINPICFESPPNLGAMLLEADAALLIGDPALQIHYQVPQGLYAYDLGLEWKQLTGLKMVFAVWAVRRSYAADNPEVAREVARVFIRSLRYSEKHIEQVAKDAARWETFSAEFLQEYFTTLQYGFDAGHQNGLLEYYRRAYALGYIAEIPQLDFLEV
ncbi:menaquinone biosynthesis protein [Sporomusa sp.]|uniref:menaquinone biosynthetic enzyme MqnA/MqnD family protein n=1 Tax=Sporomusa sp. TaxID=2078658 RepID=UPI002BD66FB3|nr:menaquinone biosynthesis protein [Sporomusa sp.]HWR41958.1 menaquinone biosynthesis protein [Sporomusa sp.]